MTCVAIVGATGHVGGALARRLLERGVTVRAIGRAADRLEPLVAGGAVACVGDAHDARFLASAFRGADGVFAMIPPAYDHPDPRADRRQVADALAAGTQVARVEHAVTLSSIGADQLSGTGPIAGLREFEERFNQVPGLNIVHLRPGYFYSNLLYNVRLIKSAGVNGGLIDPDVQMAMVDPSDIAAVAASLLAIPDFNDRRTQELRAPRTYSQREATAILGQAIGQPDLAYVQFGEADTRQALQGLGFSAVMVDLYVEMLQAFNKGIIRPRQPLSDETRAPTTLEQFARTAFAPAFAR